MKLPVLKPRQAVQILKRLGFTAARQTGSHLILAHTTTKKIVPIPIHARDIKRGLLRSIIRQTGLTVEDFCKLL